MKRSRPTAKSFDNCESVATCRVSLMPLPVILMYHSIDDPNGRSDTWNLSISPDNFASQIEALVSEREVVPVEELGRCVHAGRIPERYAAITFDDGYANNLALAKPILEHYKAPATIFLMTSTLDKQGFWWDRLERVIMDADFLPAKLFIPLLDQTFEVPVAEDRAEVHFAVWNCLRKLDPDHRDKAIAHLADMLDVQPDNPALRPLTTHELQQLNGIISVGAHTLSHPSLPQLCGAKLIGEIADSKAICESLLNRQITMFAYPFGDYDDKVRAAVAEAGLTLACTTEGRSIQAGDDCLALPRIAVSNCTGEEFIRSLPQRGL